MFYAPGQDAQHPTHTRLHVRDARDAQTVFEAVRKGALKKVTRRLNEVERSMFIQSGAIFVWEESDDEMGLKRWTDGRVWGQSRMREPYLFYDEKLPTESGGEAEQSSKSQAMFRFVDGSSKTHGSSVLSHFDRTAHRPPGLVKQAYSAYVMTSPNSKPRKWHLTAYFTYSDLRDLPTIDRDPILRTVSIPPGVYRSGKARSRNSELRVDTTGSSETYLEQSPPPHSHTSSSSGFTSPANNSPILWRSKTPLPPQQSLPPLVSIVAQGEKPPRHGTPTPRASAIDARCAEDQRMIRMLNSRHVG